MYKDSSGRRKSVEEAMERKQKERHLQEASGNQINRELARPSTRPKKATRPKRKTMSGQ
jgi:hypothetical protein